jgi:hypothetical protein
MHGTRFPRRAFTVVPEEVAVRSRVVVDPLTRIEGHLRVEAVVDNGVVVEARSAGTLYRGFEQILQGATCSMPSSSPSASAASAHRACRCVVAMPGQRVRSCRQTTGASSGNLIQGANYIQSTSCTSIIWRRLILAWSRSSAVRAALRGGLPPAEANERRYRESLRPGAAHPAQGARDVGSIFGQDASLRVDRPAA